MSISLDSLPPTLYGHKHCEEAFRTAYDSGHMHHAWLLHGEEGIGKTCLAYKIAAFVLGANRDAAPYLADIDKNNPVIKRMHGGSHPHFLLITGDKTRRNKASSPITIDAIRAIHEFLSVKPSAHAMNVVLLDNFRDVVLQASHALLKILEEPPSRSLFLITTEHASLVPATIRSRCRLARLSPLSQEAFSSYLTAHHKNITQDHEDLYHLSAGAPGRLHHWLSPKALSLYQELKPLMTSITQSSFDHMSLTRYLHHMEKLMLSDAQEDSMSLWRLFWDYVFYWLHDTMTHSHPFEKKALFTLWDELLTLRQQGTALHLAPSQIIVTAFSYIHTAWTTDKGQT
ncbi:MAG: AAA family ATPase [Alphaproteobacteria bacterium GM7ARS4]|nr:AAA family ATPase [Alphaproteobacteria bacterium GM7ARS4]